MSVEVKAGCGCHLLSHIPAVPKTAFCGYHCLNGGGYGTSPYPTTGLGSGWVCGQWDGTLHPQAVYWKTPGDAEHCFLIHLTLPEAPWAQRGKLRQSRQCSQAQPQHQIQALSIPKSLLVLCSSEQTYSLCSHYGFLTAMRQNNDISPSFYLTILRGIVAEGMDWAGRDGSNPSGKFLPSKCAEPLGK